MLSLIAEEDYYGFNFVERDEKVRIPAPGAAPAPSGPRRSMRSAPGVPALTQVVKTHAPESLRRIGATTPTLDMQEAIIRCMATNPAERPSLRDLCSLASTKVNGSSNAREAIFTLQFNAPDGT